jgi:hypothetical protein
VPFPIRDAKKIIEADSMRVLRNTLPKEWIYRHETADDYGIDVEIEMVTTKRELQGDFFKGQVKGETDLKFAKDDSVGVSGIKQTTLAYWLGISRYLNVIGLLVDIPGNKVYWTPLFWEAATLLDGGEATKTIHFKRISDLADRHSFANLVLNAAGPTPICVIRAHRRLLRMMPVYMELLDNAIHCDAATQPDNDSIFRSFLEDCRVLCHLQAETTGTAPYSPRHWYERSMNQFGDYPMYGTIREAITQLLPALLERLQGLQRGTNNSRYFWEHSDRHYLETVLAIPVPENLGALNPADWGHRIAGIHAQSGHLI